MISNKYGPIYASNQTRCLINDICGVPAGLQTMEQVNEYISQANVAPSGIPNPNQWSRFITPIFFHGSVLHFLINMSLQMRTGFGMEQDFGSLRIGAIYIISGIGGNILGANFSPMLTSVGCSGSLFGTNFILDFNSHLHRVCISD